VLQTMRYFAQYSSSAGQSNAALVMRCIGVCLLGCLEQLMQYFNEYAYAHVAIYGVTYCESAKMTWNLIKARGFDLLINDNLIDGALFLGVFMIGVLTAIAGFVLAFFTFSVDYSGVWAAVGFLIGLSMGSIVMSVIDSAVVTCFVCYAEDPEALARTKPDEYNRLTNAFQVRLGALRQRQNQQQQRQQQNN